MFHATTALGLYTAKGGCDARPCPARGMLSGGQSKEALLGRICKCGELTNDSVAVDYLSRFLEREQW